jgi:hypothetical protein
MLTFYTSPVFNLPSGPKNLSVLFPSTDWNQVDHYYVEVRDAADAIVLRTPDYYLGCCCADDKVRLHFRNGLGAFDAVNFQPPQIVHENSSAEYRKQLPTSLQKTDAASERFNIRSNVTYTCMTDCYNETDMPWLMELADTGKALMEWTGTQGQSDSYIPVIILDGKYDKKKINDAWLYQFSVSFKMSNENILQR